MKLLNEHLAAVYKGFDLTRKSHGLEWQDFGAALLEATDEPGAMDVIVHRREYLLGLVHRFARDGLMTLPANPLASPKGSAPVLVVSDDGPLFSWVWEERL